MKTKLLLFLSLLLTYAFALGQSSSLTLDSQIPLSTEKITSYRIINYNADMIGKVISVQYEALDSSGKVLSLSNYTILEEEYDMVMAQVVSGTMQQAIGQVFYGKLMSVLGVTGSVGIGHK